MTQDKNPLRLERFDFLRFQVAETPVDPVSAQPSCRVFQEFVHASDERWRLVCYNCCLRLNSTNADSHLLATWLDWGFELETVISSESICLDRR